MTDYFIYLDSYIFPIIKKKSADKTDDNYECLLNMRTTFDKLHDSYAKHYSTAEHLASD